MIQSSAQPSTQEKGIVLLEQRNYNQAVQQFNLTLSQYPNDRPALIAKGYALLGQLNYKDDGPEEIEGLVKTLVIYADVN